MTPRTRWIILSLAIVGFGFAAYSAWVHYHLMTDAAYVSPCDISSTFNCSQVYLSRYGSVAGVPVALGGMFWFGLVALIAMFSSSERSSSGTAWVFGLSTIALAVILYLGYTSFFVLKQACILCLGTYVSVLGIFIASGLGSSVSLAQLPSRAPKDVGGSLRDPFVLVLALMLLGGIGYTASIFPEEGTRPKPAEVAPTAAESLTFDEQWARQPRVDLGVPAEGAEVVIVKFNDFLCPMCKDTWDWYKPVLAKFAKSNPGAVKFVLKDWPWDTECNFNGIPGHELACEAAAAVRMARQRGAAKGDEMESWIYSNQRTTATAIKDAVKRIAGAEFDREYSRYLGDVRKDIADGAALGIRGTPTLFINGVRVDQPMPASYLELAILLELKKAAGK